MRKISGRSGHPRCKCESDVRVIKRIYGNSTEHWWLECTRCGKLGGNAVRKDSIPHGVRAGAPVRKTRACIDREQGRMSIFGGM